MTPRTKAADKRRVVLRLEPDVVDAIEKWADEELRSSNSQIEHMLRRVLVEEDRMPSQASLKPRRRS